VFGAEVFGPAAGNLRVLAAYLPVVFVNIVFGAAIMAAGRLTPWIRAKLVSVVVAVVVSVVLIPLSQSALGNGGIGVAAGTMAAVAWALRDSNIALRVGMSVTVYLASACLLGAIRREDLRFIRDVVRLRSPG
jgi:O-antigen/teichoic acid export membrane protein